MSLKKSNYEKELEEFYDFDDDDIQTDYVLDDYDNPYENCGRDTTIRSVEELKEMMGTEFKHLENHINKTKEELDD